MQTPDRRPPVGVAFDSSIEDGIDQILALAMLHALNLKRDIRLAAVSVSRNNLSLAAFCDVIGRFFGSNSPVGMFEKGAATQEVPAMVASVLSRTAEDRPVYPRNIARFNDTADPVATIRNALTAQQDQNATVILAGPPVNLLGMVRLPGTAQLVEKKVRSLVVAGPYRDAAGFAELLAKWPGTIVFADEDLNQSMQFPSAAIEQDFTWATNHPVVDAYRAAGKMPYDSPITATAAVLHAAYPDQGYFSLSEPGVATVSDRGQLQFKPDQAGRHRRLRLDSQQKEMVVQALRQLISSRPPEPRRGGRGPQP